MHLLLVLLSVYVIFSKNSFTPAPFLERSECKGTHFQHTHQTFRGLIFVNEKTFISQILVTLWLSAISPITTTFTSSFTESFMMLSVKVKRTYLYKICILIYI